MRVVIIEDEQESQEKLKQYLYQYNPEIEIVAVLSSVSACQKWFSLHKHPDLIVSDIELTDGNVFDFFEIEHVRSPVIFTTHFESFMKRAFEEFSVSFLIKPYTFEEFGKALQKYDTIRSAYLIEFDNLRKWQSSKPSYRKRFISKVKGQYSFVNAEDILYFNAKFRGVYLFSKQGKKYLQDKSLNQIEQDLDPSMFFKANRNYIVSVDAISKIINLPDGSVIIVVSDKNIEVKITRTRVREFREWLDK